MCALISSSRKGHPWRPCTKIKKSLVPVDILWFLVIVGYLEEFVSFTIDVPQRDVIGWLEQVRAGAFVPPRVHIATHAPPPGT